MDFHGQSVAKAAQKAVKDAVSRVTLSGLTEVLELDDLNNQLHIRVSVAASRPEDVDEAKIREVLPVGKVEIHALPGGLQVPGTSMVELGDKEGDMIEVAVAAVEVGIVK